MAVTFPAKPSRPGRLPSIPHFIGWVRPYHPAVDLEGALRDFASFAESMDFDGIKVHRALVALDERQDGEPVTRSVLLVDNPRGNRSTWELDSVIGLRRTLAEHAAQLGLPPLSVSLVPEREASSVESFVR